MKESRGVVKCMLESFLFSLSCEEEEDACMLLFAVSRLNINARSCFSYGCRLNSVHELDLN